MSNKVKIVEVTYGQARLDYFTKKMHAAHRKYRRLFKRYQDAPYLSEGATLLSDAGQESIFYHDVVEMLENYEDLKRDCEVLRKRINGQKHALFEYQVHTAQLQKELANAKAEWISVDERLPEDGQAVLIYDGNATQWEPSVSVARFERGRTAEELRNSNYRLIRGCDEDGNNKKPYRWNCPHSHMSWFGQTVTHWMPLPEAPKMDGGK